MPRRRNAERSAHRRRACACSWRASWNGRRRRPLRHLSVGGGVSKTVGLPQVDAKSVGRCAQRGRAAWVGGIVPSRQRRDRRQEIGPTQDDSPRNILFSAPLLPRSLRGVVAGVGAPIDNGLPWAKRRTTQVTLRRWGTEDLPLLELSNTPEMTGYLGGPESPEEVRERHERYLRLNAAGEAHMFRIDVDGTPAGGIGWWQTDHEGVPAYEAGWSVLPEWQGRGRGDGRPSAADPAGRRRRRTRSAGGLPGRRQRGLQRPLRSHGVRAHRLGDRAVARRGS